MDVHLVLARKLKKRLLQAGLLVPKPTTLNVFTTNRCNFSCFYCNRNVRDDASGVENRYEDKSEFHIEDLRSLLDRYPSIKHVSFVGIGEPFLINDLVPMARLSKEHTKQVSVITNGSLLHRHWGDIGSLFNQISISLHGLTAAELRTISKVGEHIFNQVVENVRYLVCEERCLNPSLKIQASVVVLKQNLERVSRAARFCMENLIPELELQNYLPYGLEDCDNCLFDDDKECIAFLDQLVREFAGAVKIHLPTLVKRDENALSWGCTSFFNTLRVDGLGQVSGCSRIMVPMAKNGNFRDDMNVWQNAYFTEMRQRFKTRQGLPACCRYCPEAQ